MKFALLLGILLGIANKFISANGNIHQSIQEDLKNLNATCPFTSSCKEGRTSDTSSIYSCHCSSICTRLNTCCTDSIHKFDKSPQVGQTCRSISDSKAYFMIDRCPKSDSGSSVWGKLCHEEWNGENDIMKLIPVTSVYTHITYKNYFCLKCHEACEDILFWNVNLKSDYEFDKTIDENRVTVNYVQTSRTWVAPLGQGGVLIPVNISVNVPTEIRHVPIFCQPNVISRCAVEWTDKDVSDKCEAYMGMVYIERDSMTLRYRNVHCALCNFEDLANMSCTERGIYVAWGMPFSFTHLLDVNRSDGDEVGKVRRCENDFLWDPFAKKCRKLDCALPGYVIKNGKCTPP